MKRGAVLHYTVGSQRVRAVVITADRYNPRRALIAPLTEQPPPERCPAWQVPLAKGAEWPVAAVVDLSRARPLNLSAVAGEARLLPDSALRRLSAALRAYLP